MTLASLPFALSVQKKKAFSGELWPTPRRRLGYVLRNYERYGVSRPTMNGAGNKIFGLPDTVKLVYPDPVPLDEPKQWYWFGLLVKVRPDWSADQLRKAWKSLTADGRAFTDHASREQGYCDYILGVNLGMEPIRFNPIVTGGNVVEILGDAVYTGGSLCYPIRTLDGPAGEWPHVFSATISRRDGLQADGTWAREDLEIPFPQLDGVDVPVPLFSQTSVNYIRTDRVRELAPGEPFPSPYNPG
jgi:hypothetical protein